MEEMTKESEKDAGKGQFQYELNKLFERRGVIADLRSHLRHLMITALQSTQAGLKPTDRSSPKAQALNLMVAEYLFRHKCHYTLSVFTSEVPTLASFNPDVRKPLEGSKRYLQGNCFQENEVEEIFNALGISSHDEKLAFLKAHYLEKINQTPLIELFIQAVIEMSTKLYIRQNLESHVEIEGGRFLSDLWSKKIIDILLNEKMSPSQVTALEEIIFRITENEIRRIVEQEKRQQVQVLLEREKRIQEYLKKHENDILFRLIEAEKILASRRDAIDEELTKREKYLTKMAVEWKNKHEEILKLSKNFHNIENENQDLHKKLKSLKEENIVLRNQEKSQNRAIEDLKVEMNLLINKLKEVTNSNSVLSERVQALIERENKEVPSSDDVANKNQILPHADEWNITETRNSALGSGEAQQSKILLNFDSPEAEDVSSSSSSEEILLGVRRKLQDLEEETNRVNQNYLEYKLKCIPVDSDSETPKNHMDKFSPDSEEFITKETKFIQTNAEDPFLKLKKLKEKKQIKNEIEAFIAKKLDISPRRPVMRPPTKRQLRNRDFFLKSRQLLQTFENEKLENSHMILSAAGSSSYSSSEEIKEKSNSTKLDKKSSMKSVYSTLLRSPPAEALEVNNTESERKIENSSQILRSDIDCLTLLEQVRIKSPEVSARMPLRQRFLLSESEAEAEEGETEKDIAVACVESAVASSISGPSGKVSAGRQSENDGFFDVLEPVI